MNDEEKQNLLTEILKTTEGKQKLAAAIGSSIRARMGGSHDTLISRLTPSDITLTVKIPKTAPEIDCCICGLYANTICEQCLKILSDD
jgi:hypothetical protein